MAAFATDDSTLLAKKIREEIGNQIVIGIPIGAGKPISFINALYHMACLDPSLDLTIMTGLTLARPILKNQLEKVFITPILERMLGDYVDPSYEIARIKQNVPKNIRIIEFYLSPGKFVHNAYVQQHYISSIYTDVVRDAGVRGINVYAQLVAPNTNDANTVSLSCNADMYAGAIEILQKHHQAGHPIAVIAEINPYLPCMIGKALIDKSKFTHILTPEQPKRIFAIPHDRISPQDHAIGLHASRIIEDAGTLQVGIGKLGNAIAHALILRHQRNDLYQNALTALAPLVDHSLLQPFTVGLYAATEMVSDEYIQLLKADILKLRVYPHLGLQRLLNATASNPTINDAFLQQLLDHDVIHAKITPEDYEFLREFGIVKADTQFDGTFLSINQQKIVADFSNKQARQAIVTHCLGKELLQGKIVHAAFILGTNDLYQTLRDLPLATKQLIDMTSINITNQLYWSYSLAIAQRQKARFVNTALMATLSGAVVSDMIIGNQELSGVGGQFDFVVMGNVIPDARSIIMLRSTRQTAKGVVSNIVFDYPTTTLPRFLRDFIVTEYGIADCRAKTDSEIIAALLNITDSRFQAKLLKQAKEAGKISKDYEIPAAYTQNYPIQYQVVIRELNRYNYATSYPFGCDLTPIELTLERALTALQSSNISDRIKLFVKILLPRKNKQKFKPHLERMALWHPKTFKDYLLQRVVLIALNSTS